MKMKKPSFFVVCFIIAFAISTGSASAWTYCFKDVNYTPELQMSLDGNVIRGQAVLEGSPNFPAPITGEYIGGHLFFTIAYIGETGVRFYDITLANMAGQTWGIYNDTAEFYDSPHSASLVPCALAAEGEAAVESGAAE